MTNRLICCLAVSFASGILYGRTQKIWLCMAALGFIIWRAFCVKKHQGRKAILPALLHMLVCMMCFGAGVYQCHAQQQKFCRARQYAEEQETIQIQGKIYQKEEKQEQFIYYLKDAGILTGKQFYPCGRIQVYTSKGSYQMGNCILAEGRYEAFQHSHNEGNFNEEQYYYSKNINLRIRAERQQYLEETTDHYKEWLYQMRRRIEQVFQSGMSQQKAGIMANIMLGNRSLTEQEIKTLYQKAGISHILAISGLHVSLLGMGVYRLLRRFYCPIILTSVLASGIVCSFGMMTGMELSTARAVIMFLIIMAAGMGGCTYDALTALSAAAILQLWENPFALWYAGFLLSYTAVLGAVVIAGVVQKNVKRKKKDKILTIVKTSLCIQMATLPVSLFFYYEVPGYGIWTNGCVLPLMGILLFLGAAGGIVGLFHKGISLIFLKGAAGILEFCEGVCGFFTKLPGNEIITGQPSLEKILLYYILLTAILYIVSRTQKRKLLIIWSLLAVMLSSGNQHKGAEADFLDVGQGDGIFLQTASGKGIFIDGGSTDVGSVGKYRILPFLKCRGIQEISLWFISHADEDHVSGLKEILVEGYSVKNIVFAEGVVRDEAWKDLVNLAKDSGSRICYLGAGERICMDDMHFTVLYAEGKGTDRNRNSMVLLAEWENIAGIFSGDIGKEQEQKLVKDKCFQKYLKKSVTFYKAAHHGSDNSNSLEVLEELSPKLAVVSCGKGNPYGHPGKRAVERMEQAGAQICYTMNSGQIRLWQEEGSVLLWKFQN